MRLLVLGIATAALMSTGCNMPDMAALQAQVGCAADYDDTHQGDCAFGARSARDFLVKDFAPFGRGVDASPSLIGRAAERTHQHCDQHTGDQAGYDACVDGVTRFVEAMK